MNSEEYLKQIKRRVANSISVNDQHSIISRWEVSFSRKSVIILVDDDSLQEWKDDLEYDVKECLPRGFKVIIKTEADLRKVYEAVEAFVDSELSKL